MCQKPKVYLSRPHSVIIVIIRPPRPCAIQTSRPRGRCACNSACANRTEESTRWQYAQYCMQSSKKSVETLIQIQHVWNKKAKTTDLVLRMCRTRLSMVEYTLKDERTRPREMHPGTESKIYLCLNSWSIPNPNSISGFCFHSILQWRRNKQCSNIPYF